MKLDNPQLHTFPSNNDFFCSPSTAKCKVLFNQTGKYIWKKEGSTVLQAILVHSSRKHTTNNFN